MSCHKTAELLCNFKGASISFPPKTPHPHPLAFIDVYLILDFYSRPFLAPSALSRKVWNDCPIKIRNEISLEEACSKQNMIMKAANKIARRRGSGRMNWNLTLAQRCSLIFFHLQLRTRAPGNHFSAITKWTVYSSIFISLVTALGLDWRLMVLKSTDVVRSCNTLHTTKRLILTRKIVSSSQKLGHVYLKSEIRLMWLKILNVYLSG